jgi:acyl-CoA thioester hydrolase
MELKSFYIVRFGDCDPYGHLNNARYIDYMINAREDHLREYYNISLPEFMKQGQAWVVRQNNIQYIRPANYNERICIISRLAELTDTYVLVEILMFDENATTLKAILWTTFTSIDPRTGRKQAHSELFMEWAKTVELHDINITAGIGERVKELLNPA